MIFQALVKSEKLNLNTLSETGHIIQKALTLIDNNQYADAKLSIVSTKPTVISNIINLYGSESDYFVKHLRPYLKIRARRICPKPVQLLEFSAIILRNPSDRNAEKQEDKKTMLLHMHLRIGHLLVSHIVRESLLL